MKQIVSLLLICITVAVNAQKQKFTIDKRFEGLDTAFERVLKEWKAPGFAVAVVEKNKVVYAKGFGYSNWEKKIPVTPNTLFAIGSCTKAFTSAQLGLLQSDGKVSFDKKVTSFLPNLEFYNAQMNSMIKVRDLMCHRTGLPRYDYSWYMFGTESADSLIQRIKFMEPTYEVREKWQYNNFMFLLQGAIAEKITGKTWQQLLRKNFFDPLSMHRTNFSVDSMAKDADAAIGYGLQKDTIIKKQYYHIKAMEAAGAINSSVNEMANWVKLWINGGKLDGKTILPASYITEAISSQMVIGAGLPGAENPDLHLSNYGFGWFLSSYKGHYRVEHGGNIDGFSASTCFFPSDSVGIVVLTNQDGSQVPAVVRNIMADRMLGVRNTDWQSYLKGLSDKAKKTASAKDSSSKKPIIAPTHPLKDYSGLYSNEAFGTFEVALQNDSLWILLPEHTWLLKPYAYDAFSVYEKDYNGYIDTTADAELKPQFFMNEAGEITSVQMQLEPGIKPIEFIKKPKPAIITANTLNKYVGEYFLSGITVSVYIKEGKTLFVLVPGQPEYELVPIETDKFAIKVATGFYVKFSLNAKGEVTDLSFIQPNGTFKAVKK